MKKYRFSEHQIIKILKKVDAGRTPKEVCLEHGISNATYHAWKSKFGRVEASDIGKLWLRYTGKVAEKFIPLSQDVFFTIAPY